MKAFFGCLLAQVRAVPVPLPNPHSKNPLGRLLNTARACGAATVLTNQQLSEMAALMGGELPLSFRAVTDRVATDWAGPREGCSRKVEGEARGREDQEVSSREKQGKLGSAVGCHPGQPQN